MSTPSASASSAQQSEFSLSSSAVTQEIMSAADLLQAYQNGRRDFSRIIILDAELEGADLPGIDLSHAKLKRANLRGANLSDGTLVLTDLQQADLNNANLSSANLKGVKLDGAVLQQANLNDCELTEAYLVKSNLQESSLERATLHRADLSRANLDHSKLQFAKLFAARLRYTVLRQADLRNTSFTHSYLNNADLSYANLQRSKLRHANLSNTLFYKADLRSADTQLSKSGNFSEAQLGEVDGALQHQSIWNGPSMAEDFSFDPTGEKIAFTVRETVKLTDLAAQDNEVVDFSSQPEPVVSIAFNTQKNTLDSYYYMNQLKIWSVRNLALFKELKLHPENPTSVVLSPTEAKKITLYGEDQSNQLIDIGHERRTCRGYSSKIETETTSHDGKLIARSSPSKSNYISIIESQSNQEIATIGPHQQPVQSLCFDDTGERLASMCAEEKKVWNLSRKTWEHNRRISRGKIETLLVRCALDNAGELICLTYDSFSMLDQYRPSLDSNGHPRWNSRAGRYSRTVGFCLSGDRKIIARQAEKHPVQLWDVQTSEAIGTIPLEHPSHALQAISFDGQFIAINLGTTLEIWDTIQKQAVQHLKKEQETGKISLEAVLFTPNNQYLIASYNSGLIHIWEVATGSLVQTFRTHACIKALTIDASSRWLASGDSSGLVILWDLEQKAERHRFQASEPGLNETIRKLEFRPNRKQLMTCDGGGNLCLWELGL